MNKMNLVLLSVCVLCCTLRYGYGPVHMRAFYSSNGIQHKNDIIHLNVNQRRDHKQAIKCNGFSEDESQQIIIIIAIIIIIINMVLDSNVRTRAKHPLNELYYNHSVGRFPHLAFPLEI